MHHSLLLLVLMWPLTPERLQPAADAGAECSVDSDCVIVVESWCRSVVALPKAKQREWEQHDAEHREKAAAERQECEPGSAMSKEIFAPACLHGRCVAVLRN